MNYELSTWLQETGMLQLLWLQFLGSFVSPFSKFYLLMQPVEWFEVLFWVACFGLLLNLINNVVTSTLSQQRH
jgi:hypothetical protein